MRFGSHFLFRHFYHSRNFCRRLPGLVKIKRFKPVDKVEKSVFRQKLVSRSHHSGCFRHHHFRFGLRQIFIRTAQQNVKQHRKHRRIGFYGRRRTSYLPAHSDIIVQQSAEFFQTPLFAEIVKTHTRTRFRQNTRQNSYVGFVRKRSVLA